MSHVSEEELVLLYYGESEDSDAVKLHLEGCRHCREEYRALEHELGEVSHLPLPERDAAYGSRVWSAIAPKLASRRRSRVWVLAVAAAVLAGTFLAGRLSTRWDAEPETAEIRERILLVALGDHLDRSQILLLEVVNAPEAGLPSATARELVRESRLYRQTAHGVGDVATTQMLEELERLLLDVAHGASSSADLRARIEEQDVLFKIRVLQTNVRQREEELKPRRF